MATRYEPLSCKKMKKIFRIKPIAALVVLSLPVVAQAAADEQTLPAVQVSAQTTSGQTEDSTSYTADRAKTATPLTLSLRDTPQSVSVVTQQRIQDQGALDITDVINSTTGVSVHQYETNRAQFTARGFDINTLMIDGVPTTYDQSWSAGEVADSLAPYDRVEIVRGATGLTTGAGDPSAAINLVRKRADSTEFKGDVELGVGSWNQHREAFDLSTPLNEAKTVRARIVGESVDGDSWVQNLHKKDQTVYATVEADLTSTTLLTAGVSRQDNKNTGVMWGGLPVWYSDGSRTNWDISKTTAADWSRWDSDHEDYFLSLEQKFSNGWKLKANYDHGERNGESYLLYLYGNPDRVTGSGMGAGAGAYETHRRQDDISLTANGPFELFGRKHELAVGYLYSEQNFHADTRGYISGTVSNFNLWDGSYAEPTWNALGYYGKATTRQSAGYAALRLNVADQLRLILGARVTQYSKSYDDIYDTHYQYNVSSQLTPYAGVIYDLNDHYSWYASYTDIFQPQQNRDINGKYLDPIVGKSMETGIKGEFFDGALNASAAIFNIKQDNLAQSIGQYIPGTTEYAYRAADGATSKGYELEVSGELSPGWSISAGWTQFQATDATGADVNTIYPRKLVKLSTAYHLPGAFNAWTLGGGLTWQGSTYTDATNPSGATERIEQSAFALVNLMVRYDITKQLSAQLNVNNLSNKTYFNIFDAYGQITYGAPRNAMLTMKYKF